jgi:hypothetical protein
MRARVVMDQPYRYKQLSSENSIRILKLLPGRHGEALCAHLDEAELTSEPHEPIFAALSYCWGTSGFDADLMCDGRNLKITKSLATALVRIRDQETMIPLWVDQVCINQQDIPERNAQVKLMGRIYTKAVKVAIWLGDDDEFKIPRRELRQLEQWSATEQEADVTSSRLQILIERLSQAQEKRDKIGDTRNRHQLQWIGLRDYGLPDTKDAGYSAFTRLLQRPYFSRGWILQEVALSRDHSVRFGTARVSLADFYRALFACASLGFNDNVRTTDIQRLTGIMKMRQAHSEGKKVDLLNLLLQTRATLTTDPRDKIYCLLGISSDQELLQIEPNYEESVENVYRNFTLRHIEVYGSLDILTVPRSEHHNTSPSWIHDWRLSDASAIASLDGREADQICLYRATKETRASITASPNPAVIGLSGFNVDTVEACGCMEQSEEVESELPIGQRVRHAFHEALSLRLKLLDWKHVGRLHTWQPYPTGESRDEAFWRCLTAGRAFKPDMDLGLIRKYYQAWSRYLFLHSTLLWIFPNFARTAIFALLVFLRMFRTGFALCCFLPLYRRNRRQEAFSDLCTAINGRVIIRTKHGYMGLAPENTKEGDSIFLLEGGKLPFVMRKNGENWAVIGDCYLHGIMNGEAFENQKCGTVWIE